LTVITYQAYGVTHGTPEPSEGKLHATAVINRRLALVDERGALDVATVSEGRFWPAPQAVYQQRAG
jgi:hypothetical protein